MAEVPAPHSNHLSIEDIQLEHDRKLTVVMLAVILIPTLWFAFVDLRAFASDPVRLQARFVVRFFNVIALVAGIVLVQFTRDRRSYAHVVLGAMLANALTLVSINGLRPQGSVLPVRSVLTILIIMYAGVPNTFFRQIIPPLLMTAGVIGLRVFWLTSDVGGDFQGDFLNLLLVNTVGVVMVRRRLKQEYEVRERFSAEQKATAELRTLHGILPICSYCKQIRTEEGEWERIETYVRNHTEAEFSHGVCPDCMQKHHGAAP